VRGTGPVFIQEFSHDIKNTMQTISGRQASIKIDELREKEEVLKQELLVITQKLAILAQ
jgi:hypothetical protein